MTESNGSVSSFLGALLGGGNSSNNSSNGPFQRTLSTTATVGLSFFILRFVVTAAKAVAEDDDDNDSSAIKEVLKSTEVLYQFVRSVLRKMIHQTVVTRGFGLLGNDDDDDEEGSEEEENVPMIHKGSCHCRAVCFELIAPTRILCKEAQNGKIQYRHARIRAKSFRFVSGAQFVKMYYVNKSPEEVGAHSFCSRCGVHFLHAPNSRSTALDVNVDCLNQQDSKIKSAKAKRVDLSKGIPVVDQWENEEDIHANSLRYPATIAEEHSPMGASMPFDKSSPFAAYKHHPLMRHHHHQDFYLDPYLENNDDSNTIDLVFPDSKLDTPSTTTHHTVYTTQTEPLSSTGVPPTLTLDTRAYPGDSESVVTLTSTKSGYPLEPSRATPSPSFGAKELSSPFGGGSPPSNSGIAPSTTPLVRHQMNFYMRKHMSSTSSVSSSSSRISPRHTNNSGTTLPAFPTVPVHNQTTDS